MATNERQNTGNNNNNKKELEVQWWDRKGWATLGGVNSLEELEGNGTPLQYSCLETPMDRGV